MQASITVNIERTNPASGSQSLLARACASLALADAVAEQENEAMNKLLSQALKAAPKKPNLLIQRFTHKPAVQDSFASAYQHVSRTVLFDTLMDLEHSYCMAVRACMSETAFLREREGSSDLAMFDATRDSILTSLRAEQRAEYRDFVTKVHNELLAHTDVPFEKGSVQIKPLMSESSSKHASSEDATISLTEHRANATAITSSLAKLNQESDSVLEGALGKLRRSPSKSLMRVGSVEAVIATSSTSPAFVSSATTPKLAHELSASTTDISVSVDSESNDPELDIMVFEIKEMGFTQDQAKAALELEKRNLERALNLLLENPSKVEKQIRDSATRSMLFPDGTNSKTRKPAKPSRSISSSSLAEISRSSPGGLDSVANPARRVQSNPWNNQSSQHQHPSNPSPLSMKKTVVTASTASMEEVNAKRQQQGQTSAAAATTFSPFAFIQQQQAKISADLAALTGATVKPGNSDSAHTASGITPNQQLNNFQKGFTNFLGKAMEALHIEPMQSNETDVPDKSHTERSESFTAYFGTQVRTMYTIRLSIVPSLSDAVLRADNSAQEQILRAQTTASLNSNNLSGCVLLLSPSQVDGYAYGTTVNQAFISRCREATEFHFEDFEIQWKKALDKCPLDDFGYPVLREGDFFTTRHSNLPQIHVLFHLIVPDDELYSVSPVMVGYRNILKLAHMRDINHLFVPILLQTERTHDQTRSYASSATHSPTRSISDQIDARTPLTSTFENTAALAKQTEAVLKGTKGLIMEQTRSIKHSGDSRGVDTRSRSIQFVVPLDSCVSSAAAGGGGVEMGSAVVEEGFQVICGKISDVFRTV
ncbi:hypothetical protein BJ741DRAFT_628825 [Chytriomyces cf. hyalinus JEL632]|nr:hypothetical protein BJ741DRAFT_628825 [Chytriomyces cf. hyalinus JEL632]